MHSLGINAEGELSEQPANPGLPGKMAVNGVSACLHVCGTMCLSPAINNIFETSIIIIIIINVLIKVTLNEIRCRGTLQSQCLCHDIAYFVLKMPLNAN